MKQRKKPKGRPKLLYTDGDAERFEGRLLQNADKSEPRVPAMLASAGKRTKFTGMTAKGTVAALRKSRKKKRPTAA
jgi:hypothetical protein